MAGEVYHPTPAGKTGASAELNGAGGVEAQLLVPVFVGHRFWGTLNFDDCTAERAWADGEVQALQAAAGALAAAVRREGLEAEKVEAAARAAETAKVNEALRRAADGLAGVAAVEEVLAVFLREAVVVAGATDGAVLRRVEATPHTFEFVALFDRGAVLTGEALRGVEMARTLPACSAADTIGYFARVARGETALWKLPELDGFFPEGAAWQRARGNRTAWDVPFAVGGRVVGYLGLAYPDEREPDPLVRQTVAALAAQCGVALEFTRLADAARAAAVAREREAAAERRAAERARAHDALARSVRRLDAAGDLSGFLAAVVQEALTASGAVTGAVFLHDPAAAALRTAVLVLRGRVLDAAADAEAAPYRDPAPTSGNGPWEKMSRGREVYWIDYAAPPPDDWPQSKGFHDRHGHRQVGCLPLFDGDAAVGFLGLAFDAADPVEPRAARVELCGLLAQQAAVAVRLSRLADAAREAAVAREREAAAEQRVAELARANEALRRTLAHLVAEPDPQAFLASLLGEVARQLGADAAQLARYDASTATFVNVAGYLDGEPYLLDIPPTVPESELGAAPLLRADPRPRFFDLEAEGHLFWPGTVEFHRTHGIRAVYCVPLASGERFVGFIGCAFRRPVALPAERVELVQALAQQATLAVELIRLGDEARKAAVARAREAAAEARAAELAKANEALSRSLDGLTGAGALPSFLEGVLREAIAASGAVSGAVFVHDRAADALRAAAFVVRGEAWDVATDPRAAPYREPTPAGTGLVWEIMGGRHEVFWIDYSTFPDPRDWPLSFAWHRANGHRFVGCVPMLLAGRAVGFLGLCFDESEEARPTETRLELCRALAQQAILALHLTRLADEAREAAVAREREAAAERRAAELAEANEALRLRDNLLTAAAEALKGLLGADDFEAAMPVALRRLGEAAGIHRVKVILQRHGPGGPFHELTQEWWADGLASQASHGLTRFDDHVIAEYLAPLRAGECLWHHFDQVPAVLRGPFERVGMRSMGVVPVFAGPRYAGLVAFDDCAGRRVWTQAEMDALTVAARAIGAAIHRREIEREKTEAVARERAAATERHLAEVEGFNRALRRSSARLALGADARGFLGHVLAECLGLIGADFGHVLTYQPADDALRFAVGARPGETYFAPLPDEAEAFGDPIPAAAFPVFALLRERRRPAVLSRDAGEAPPNDRVGRWFAAQGAQEALCLLLAVGDEPLGLMGLVFRAPRVLRPEELELFEALANQAALAVALARLGDRARAAAVTEERNRLAREIHDTLAQGFTGVILHLQLAQRALPADPGKADSRVGAALDLARDGLREARRSVWALLPEAIEAGDLPAALRRLAERLGATSADAAVGFALEGDPRRLPPEAEAELLRVAQEALCNALKHAAARAVTVRLAFTPEGVRLSVEDDGRGFDPAAPGSTGSG